MVSTQHSLQLRRFRTIKFFMYNFTDIFFFFFAIRKSGNHFVRNSGGFSFPCHSKLRMGDNGTVALEFRTFTFFLHFCTDNYLQLTTELVYYFDFQTARVL